MLIQGQNLSFSLEKQNNSDSHLIENNLKLHHVKGPTHMLHKTLALEFTFKAIHSTTGYSCETQPAFADIRGYCI